ncbi:tRNA glutamyl-Q(34) synthetase GluQRS [Intestinimonas massiliensis (ex Afouda et al. 2020)]|uniref:tRNA glutamyl-Q(34) synthetase GluQRS n=1 Tax=Intestinimonas massiliensis (ex Afouda et al. 2020) TaxID=1673721 RepID=UPI00102FB441|nr:tRNA glutamyl-Q(34) synthetase GluQRS [Intestinimonas massiliensis (ex Afouda et al. 2020)]
MGELRGRFAPSPSGRMHLGNLFSGLLAWLSVRSAGGVMVLRMEDLDPDRCREEYAVQLADDLLWLGLDWDEGYGKGGPHGPYRQSDRTELYAAAFRKLEEQGLIYPCFCTRAERLAASAPHRSDGQTVYSGKCRNLTEEQRTELARTRRPAWRLIVPDREVSFTDGVQGRFEENLLWDCGDFILRRSDGVYAYQLAVVYDDGAMAVNQVVRGRDLLDSTPRQLYLYELLGLTPPEFYHVPLLVAPDGRRLSKREKDLDMGALRQRFTPAELTGLLAFWAGQLEKPEPVTPAELARIFDWSKVPENDITIGNEL